MSRLKTWTKEQWDLAAWGIWRNIIERFGARNYDKSKISKWYFNFDKWVNEFNNVSDLRQLARVIVKSFEDKNE